MKRIMKNFALILQCDDILLVNKLINSRYLYKVLYVKYLSKIYTTSFLEKSVVAAIVIVLGFFCEVYVYQSDVVKIKKLLADTEKIKV